MWKDIKPLLSSIVANDPPLNESWIWTLDIRHANYSAFLFLFIMQSFANDFRHNKEIIITGASEQEQRKKKKTKPFQS